MKPGLRWEIFARCRGHCECGCGKAITDSTGFHCDHFFGRAKAEESRETVWALHPTCDVKKTENKPDGSEWCKRFAAHCDRHGYVEQAKRAREKKAWLDTKRDLTAKFIS